MEQFIALAAAHFVALLVPGPDFFVIARAAIAGGGRYAVASCVGIACGNGVYIATALSGFAVVSHPIIMLIVQTSGGVFLFYVSIASLAAGSPALTLAGYGAWMVTVVLLWDVALAFALGWCLGVLGSCFWRGCWTSYCDVRVRRSAQ